MLRDRLRAFLERDERAVVIDVDRAVQYEAVHQRNERTRAVVVLRQYFRLPSAKRDRLQRTRRRARAGARSRRRRLVVDRYDVVILQRRLRQRPRAEMTAFVAAFGTIHKKKPGKHTIENREIET